MAKQTKPVDLACAAENCHRQATIGVYRWTHGASDVDLNYPVGAYCGGHKPYVRRDWMLRLVKIDLSLITEN